MLHYFCVVKSAQAMFWEARLMVLAWVLRKVVICDLVGSVRLNDAFSCSKKEARAAKDKLRNVKHLGEAGDDVDDIKAWAARSKKAEEVRKKQERLKAERLAKQLDEQVGHSCMFDLDWPFWITTLSQYLPIYILHLSMNYTTVN